MIWQRLHRKQLLNTLWIDLCTIHAARVKICSRSSPVTILFIAAVEAAAIATLVVVIPVASIVASPIYIIIAAIGVIVAVAQTTWMGKGLNLSTAPANTPKILVSGEVRLCSTNTA